MGDVHLEVLDGGLGVAPATGDELHAVIGCTSAGVDSTIVYTRDPKAMVASKGRGPAVEAAALNATKTGLPLLLCKVPSAVDGFVIGSTRAAVNLTSSTNATPTVVTASAAHGLKDGAVVTIAGHTTNTAANGTHVAHVLSDTTFSLPSVAGIGAGAAGTVQDTGVVALNYGTGTSVPTISGLPNDSRSFRFRWVKGGTRGTAGATFQYSKDGGSTYSPTLSLGASTSYTIPDTGISIAFSVGTFVAGEEWHWKTEEPHWDIGDVVDMIASLKSTGYQFRLIELVGAMSASDATSLSTALEDLRVNYRYTRLIGHARDIDASDTDQTDYEQSLSADVAALSDGRVSMTAGYYRVPSVIDKAQYRRPLLFSLIPRIMSNPIQVSPAKVRPSGGGALSGMNTPSQSEIDSKGLDSDLYIDTNDSPALKSARYITARTRIGRPGWFVDEASTFASPESDYTFLPLAFVIDKACAITYQWLVDLLDDDIDLDPDTGHIREVAAKSEESRGLSMFTSGMVAKRNCSAVTPALDRDDNILSTKTVTAHVRIVPKGYAKDVVVDVGFTNPDLATS